METNTHTKGMDFHITTRVAFHSKGHGAVEARVGIVRGTRSNMDMLEAQACEFNPYHPDFTDAHISANGQTHDEAVENLKTKVLQAILA